MTGWLMRDGLRLALHDTGGDGMPVVLQHGLCGDARQTAEAMPQVPRFRRLTLECRGHGASAFGGHISIATFAEDVAAMIEQLASPVVVGGISMGAAIALRLAVTRPDLVRALVLIRPAWVTEPAPDNMAANALVGRMIAAGQNASAFAETDMAHHLARTAPDNLASLTGFFDRAPLAQTAALLQAISADGPGVTPAQVGAITVPTLVCATDRDHVHPVDTAGRLAALTGARLVELPPKANDKLAHIAALHAALTDFLKEL